MIIPKQHQYSDHTERARENKPDPQWQGVLKCIAQLSQAKHDDEKTSDVMVKLRKISSFG
jgi:hypothetical protein